MRFRLAVPATALMLSVFSPPAPAQRVLGPGEDAWTLPGGVVRIGLDTRFFGASEVFTASGRAPLGQGLTGLLGISSLSVLQGLETTVRSLSGVNAFSVVLGTGRTNFRESRALIPLELAIGVTSNVTLRASVPFHTGEFEAQWLVDTTGATVGVNPEQLAAGPALLNAGLVSNLDTAAAQLERLADGCEVNPLSDGRCTLVLAELTQVRALVTQSRTVTDGIASTYGGRTNTTSSLFVPRAGSAAQTGVAGQIETLRTGFERYGTTSVTVGAQPVAASAPPTITELRALLADSAYGYALAPVARRYAQGFGDVDIGMTVQLYNGIASKDAWSRDPSPGVAFRQAVGLTYRVGTGSGIDPDDPFRIPTGDGQNDVEITSITDVIAGSHAWATIIARFTSQYALDGIARIPDASGSPFVPLVRRRQARTELGDRLEIAIAPRWVLNDYLSIGGRWRWLRQDGLTVTELPPFAGTNAMTYQGPTLSAHEASVGFSWSSVGPWRRGKARWPLEIHWTRSVVVSGSDGVARVTADQVSLRAYARLWGK